MAWQLWGDSDRGLNDLVPREGKKGFGRPGDRSAMTMLNTPGSAIAAELWSLSALCLKGSWRSFEISIGRSDHPTPTPTHLSYFETTWNDKRLTQRRIKFATAISSCITLGVALPCRRSWVLHQCYAIVSINVYQEYSIIELDIVCLRDDLESHRTASQDRAQGSFRPPEITCKNPDERPAQSGCTWRPFRAVLMGCSYSACWPSRGSGDGQGSDFPASSPVLGELGHWKERVRQIVSSKTFRSLLFASQRRAPSNNWASQHCIADSNKLALHRGSNFLEIVSPAKNFFRMLRSSGQGGKGCKFWKEVERGSQAVVCALYALHKNTISWSWQGKPPWIINSCMIVSSLPIKINFAEKPRWPWSSISSY